MPELSTKTFTLDEVAEFLQVHKRTVQREVAAGRLPTVKIHTAVRVLESDLHAYVRNHRDGDGGYESSATWFRLEQMLEGACLLTCQLRGEDEPGGVALLPPVGVTVTHICDHLKMLGGVRSAAEVGPAGFQMPSQLDPLIAETVLPWREAEERYLALHLPVPGVVGTVRVDALLEPLRDASDRLVAYMAVLAPPGAGWRMHMPPERVIDMAYPG